jgi:hypothetical protein
MVTPAILSDATNGAGSAEVNGCYRRSQHASTEAAVEGQGPPRFVKDASHSLYSWNGVWHLAHSGVTVFYTSTHQASLPPPSAGGCGVRFVATRATLPFCLIGRRLPGGHY